MQSPVYSHFGPRSFQSLLYRTEMTEDRSDQGPKWMSIVLLRTEVDVYFISQDQSGYDMNSLDLLLTEDVLMLPVT